MTFTPRQVALIVEASLTDPQSLGLPFGSWTMDRLAAYLREQKKLTISRSRSSELLIAEGLHSRVEIAGGDTRDPQRLDSSAPRLPIAIWSCAW